MYFIWKSLNLYSIIPDHVFDLIGWLPSSIYSLCFFVCLCLILPVKCVFNIYVSVILQCVFALPLICVCVCVCVCLRGFPCSVSMQHMGLGTNDHTSSPNSVSQTPPPPPRGQGGVCVCTCLHLCVCVLRVEAEIWLKSCWQQLTASQTASWRPVGRSVCEVQVAVFSLNPTAPPPLNKSCDPSPPSIHPPLIKPRLSPLLALFSWWVDTLFPHSSLLGWRDGEASQAWRPVSSPVFLGL